jgi:hypothetical protein
MDLTSFWAHSSEKGGLGGTGADTLTEDDMTEEYGRVSGCGAQASSRIVSGRNDVSGSLGVDTVLVRVLKGDMTACYGAKEIDLLGCRWI